MVVIEESFANFVKTSNSFLQVPSSSPEQVRRAKVAAVLQKATGQINQPKPALLAGKMVADLQIQ